MKKIFSIILSAAALFAVMPQSMAQQRVNADSLYYTDSGNGVAYGKTISAPNTDGVYTITLESFVTGEVRVEYKNAPSDIVLVLDYSGSMSTSDYFTVSSAGYSSASQVTYDQASSTTATTRYFIKVGETYFWVRASRSDDRRTYTFYYNDAEGSQVTLQSGTSNTYSSSSLYSASGSIGTRLAALKNSVEGFIEAIYENDTKDDDGVARDYPLGNRIAVVLYGNGLIDYQDFQFVTTDSGDINEDIYDFVSNGRTTTGATYTDQGMAQANSLLDGIKTARKDTSTRTVVLFTDGIPGRRAESSWITGTTTDTGSSDYVANQCISAALTAKTTHTAAVFSVGLLSGLTGDNYTKAVKYLQYTSSNYPNAQGWNDGGTTWTYSVGTKASSDYYKDAGSDMHGVFRDIASSSGGSGNAKMSEAVTAVDVVAASFKLPTGADESSIKVYTAPVIGILKNYNNTADTTYTVIESGETVVKNWFEFGDLIPVDDNDYEYEKEVDGEIKTFDIDENISVALSKTSDSNKNNKIDVSGFDYSANWCGKVTDEDGNVTYHGHKLVIQIPIVMDDEAVGGPGVDTNGDGSGIYIDSDGDGILDDKPLVDFISPKVNLPINIFINKWGLYVGESAKFTIQRAVIPDSWYDADGERIKHDDEDYESLAWEDVTSIFVTRKKSQNIDEPITKVVGMPSTNSAGKEYVYRIKEDNWSWSYTSKARTTTLSDKLVTNPFIFENTPKDQIDIKVRHAESKATNAFTTGGGVTYDDSKDNGR